METLFGVWSLAATNTKLKNGYYLFDWIMRQRCFPAFWGRPISGPDKITTDEMAFLKEKDCKTMLIFNDFSEAEISSNNGEKVAERAINAAIELGVPQNEGYAIFVYVPCDWSINHNWMLHFASLLDGHGYTPAFIGNTDSSKNFNFDRQSSHYVQAMGDSPMFETIFGATEPKIFSEPLEWSPYCPSAMNPGDIALWECSAIRFDNYYVPEIYVSNLSIVDKLW